MLGRSQKQESPEPGQWSPAVGRWACPTNHHPAAHTWAKEALNLLLSRELCLKLGRLPLYDITTNRTYNASPPLPSGLWKERAQKWSHKVAESGGWRYQRGGCPSGLSRGPWLSGHLLSSSDSQRHTLPLKPRSEESLIHSWTGLWTVSCLHQLSTRLFPNSLLPPWNGCCTCSLASPDCPSHPLGGLVRCGRGAALSERHRSWALLHCGGEAATWRKALQVTLPALPARVGSPAWLSERGCAGRGAHTRPGARRAGGHSGRPARVVHAACSAQPWV